MQHSAIYNPHANLTPSQHEAAKSRRERLDKIAALARPDTPVSCPSASLRVGHAEMVAKEMPPEPVFSFGEWLERQARINPIPKTPWFSIVSEIDGPQKRIEVKQIQFACAKFYGVTVSDIMSARRTACIVRPRQVAMYLTKTLTLKSLPEVGRRFGGRDHTTVLWAVRKITALIANDTALAEEVASLEKQLRD